MKQTFIINAPAQLTYAHLHLIQMIEADTNKSELASLVFMGAASPIAAADPKQLTNLSVEQQYSIKTLTEAYQRVATAHDASLLVCGQAARSRGIQSTTMLAEGFSFTGYMEILALCNRQGHKVITW